MTLLPADQRVQVSLDAELNVKILGQARKLSGSAQLTGRVNYHPQAQEFFLDDPQFDRLSIGGIPPEYLERVNGAASKVAQEYVQRFPIYRIQATDTRMALTKLLVKNVQIRNREVAVTMGLKALSLALLIFISLLAGDLLEYWSIGVPAATTECSVDR